MMSTVRTMVARGWRIGLGAALFLSAAASATAQWPLAGFNTAKAETSFDGSAQSFISYQNGVLTVFASAGDVLPPLPTNEKYLILTNFAGKPQGMDLDSTGSCPGGYYYVDVGGGTVKCYSDVNFDALGSDLTWPPGYWGSIKIRANYDPTANGKPGAISRLGDACGTDGP